MVRLVDGTGGGGSVKTIEQIGRTYVPANPAWDTITAMLGEVPVVGACLGPVAGLGAVRVVTSHFSVMVRGSSQLFVAGPPVVERGVGEKVSKEELGGYEIHARGSGAVDNEVASEEEALSGHSPLPLLSPFQRLAASAACAFRRRSKPPRRRADLHHSARPPPGLRCAPNSDARFSTATRSSKSAITTAARWSSGLARLNGYPVGVIANDPRHGGGAPNAPACDKMIRLIDICDTFHIPVVNFVDNPGFLIGSAAERAGTVRAGARALVAVYQASMPWISILIRRCYGVAGAGHGNAQALNLRYAWPSGDWGSLPIEGGVQAAYKREIEASPDPDAHRRQIEEKLHRFRSPLRTAEAFGIEDIIDPRDTRPLLCEWVEGAYGMLPAELGPKARTCRP